MNNPELAPFESEGMDHKLSTARRHYDKSREKVNTKLKRFLSEVNGDRTLPLAPSTQTPDIQKRRKEREERGQRIAAEQAAAYMDASKNARRRAKDVEQVTPFSHIRALAELLWLKHDCIFSPEQSEVGGVCRHRRLPDVSARHRGRSCVLA